MDPLYVPDGDAAETIATIAAAKNNFENIEVIREKKDFFSKNTIRLNVVCVVARDNHLLKNLTVSRCFPSKKEKKKAKQ